MNLWGKIISEVVALRAKTYAYLIDGYGDDDDGEKDKIINKKAKGTKKVCSKTQTYVWKVQRLLV